MPPSKDAARLPTPLLAAAFLALLAWFFFPQMCRVIEHETGDFGHFYYAADITQLSAAYQAIASQILRLSQ